MSLLTRYATLVFCSALVSLTGCVGPMACGPCGSQGPVAVNSCGGCGDCNGCGELYIDPWINHPADACDPCDKCGNYNGQSCGKCRSVFDGFASLWGYRRDAGCGQCGAAGCDGGCDAVGHGDPGCGIESCQGCQSCGGGGEVTYPSGEIIHGGDVIHDGEVIEMMPPTQASPVPTSPAQSYQPQRSRKIFQARKPTPATPPRASDY